MRSRDHFGPQSTGQPLVPYSSNVGPAGCSKISSLGCINPLYCWVSDLPCASDKLMFASLFMGVDFGALAGCGRSSNLRFPRGYWFACCLDMKGGFVIVVVGVCLCFTALAFFNIAFSRPGAGWSTLLRGLYSSLGCVVNSSCLSPVLNLFALCKNLFVKSIGDRTL